MLFKIFIPRKCPNRAFWVVDILAFVKFPDVSNARRHDNIRTIVTMRII